LKADQEQRTAKPGLAAFRKQICWSILDRRIVGKVISLRAASTYLDDPDVAIDTNHLERALRVIPMGKKNWLFCWTELGAKHVGIVQSLIATCRLHDINPYDYLVDVLQRVGQHPASLVHELTPRLWKPLFSANPLRSDLHDLRSSCGRTGA